MTLAVEKHEGESMWLVILTPTGSHRLAKFVDMAAVKDWKAAHNKAVLVGREVGRAGIG